MAVAAVASGGATMAPSATAAAHGMSGCSRCATTATAAVVEPTAANTSVEIGNQLFRRSRSEVSKAASSNTGATNRASARSGSSVQDGTDGTYASSVPPRQRKVGYGTLSRRASADSSTAPSSKAMSHSNVVKARFLSAARCSRHRFYHQIPQAHHRPDFPAAPIRATMPRPDRRGIGTACRTRSMRRIFSKPIRNAAAAALLWAASSPGAFATGTEPATDPQVDPAPCAAAAAADDADRIIAICGELVDNEKTVKADRVKALIARAGAYDRKDMIDRAIGDYDTALRLDPGIPDILNAPGEPCS